MHRQRGVKSVSGKKAAFFAVCERKVGGWLCVCVGDGAWAIWQGEF